MFSLVSINPKCLIKVKPASLSSADISASPCISSANCLGSASPRGIPFSSAINFNTSKGSSQSPRPRAILKFLNSVESGSFSSLSSLAAAGRGSSSALHRAKSSSSSKGQPRLRNISRHTSSDNFSCWASRCFGAYIPTP